MPKTKMTRDIEQAFCEWHPKKIGDIALAVLRDESTALEVPVEHGTTTAGIIDAVRISEYFGDMEYRRICRAKEFRKQGIFLKCEHGLGKDEMPTVCENTTCKWNWREMRGTPKILITCCEIKVSVEDFKSKHGHNFVGNMNFYAVPKEIYKDIEPLVPAGIGILVYYHEGALVGLRKKRNPTFREMSDEDQKWMLLSALNRIRDKMRKELWEERRRNEKEYGGDLLG